MLFGKHINRYYLRYGPLLLLGAAALVAVDYFQLVVPELYRMVINGVNDGIVAVDGAPVPFTMDFLLDRICLPLLGVIAVMVAGRFLWRVCFFGSAIRVESDLRRRMFDRCKDLSQQYYQVNKVGGLMSLFTNDLETVQECFGSGVLMLCDALLLGILAIVKMFRMDWKLTLFSLAPMVLLFFVGSTVGRYMTRKWDERQAAFSSLSDFSQETFSGIAVVKAFVKEFTELMAFRRLNRDNERTNVNYARASTLLHILVTLFVESVVCVILGYGGYLVYTGVFNAGQMVEFIGYFTAIVWPVMAVAELIEMHARGKASLSRIGALLDARPDVADAPGLPAGPQKPAAGGIAFRGLSFTYPGAAVETLHDVSFEILPGETVGVVGRTGSGKTTLADLILRVYNVPRGTLFLDGRDVNDVPIRALRDSVAYVPQDGFLFSDTIG
ncbi:MAG: ATP-binding cassette domain-containing protein, partial [Oscillospiraceae bacterium]|nr:ATP-binding cassette domain-containing protein [Oscillospiraceae bacterium]